MSFQKIAGVAGIVAALLFVVNFLAQGQPEAADASAADIVKYAVDNSGGIKLAMGAGTVLLLPLLFWGAGVMGRLRDAGGEGAAWGATGYGALVLAGALFASANLIWLPIVVTPGVRGDDSLVAFMWASVYVIGAAAFVAIAAVLLAFSCGGLRCGVGARWLNWLGIVGGVVALIGGAWPEASAKGDLLGAVGIPGYLIFVVWVLITGIELVRASPAAAAAAE